MRQRKRIHKNAKIKKKTLHWQNGRQLCNEYLWIWCKGVEQNIKPKLVS